MGQGIDLQTGDYSRGASGFWVENGEIHVEEVTIAAATRHVPHIIGVGADCDPNHDALRVDLIEQMTIQGIEPALKALSDHGEQDNCD